MNFGKINQYILFGGGELFARFLLKLKQRGTNFLAVTSERHSKESIISPQDIPLKDFLVNNHIDFIVSKDVNTDNNIIGKITKESLGISIVAAWIFKPDFIKRFEGRLVNVHCSTLPRDRGCGDKSGR